MANNFKVGDVVKTKFCSGPMTITYLGRWNNSDHDVARCTWFDGPIQKWEVCELDDLEKTVPLKRTRMIDPNDL